MSQSAKEHQIRKQMFEALYGDYQQPIERYLVKWVHDQEQASDLCQETFKQLLESLRKETVVKQYAHYRNWLYRTAKHRAIDYLRQNRPVVYLSQSESEANSWFDELRTEGHEDIIEDLICTVDDLLQLPQKQRKYLVKYAKGHNQKEIAEEEDISEATVSEYMKKGRAELRRKSFVVTADLEERKRVSKEIDRAIDLILSKVRTLAIISIYENPDFMMKEEQQFHFGRPYELVAQEVGDNLLRQYIKDDASFDEFLRVQDNALIDEGLFCYVAQGVETLEKSDYTLRDVERDLDRKLRKPMRRVLIDVENDKKGLLSDTAVLGAYGQYLF